MPPNYAYGLVVSGSPPCSPLLLSSPSFSGELLDFHDQPSNLQPLEPSTSLDPLESPLKRPSFCDNPHSEALLLPVPPSVLFQARGSAFADVSSNPLRFPADLHHLDKWTLSDEPAQSLESAVYALADEALSASKMQWPPTDSLREHTLQEALEQLNDAEDAVALRQCVVLTDIGFHLNEIATKLRAYDIDRENLTSIADKVKQVEAAARSQSISLNSAVLHHRPSMPQRNGLFLVHLQPLLDSTKHLRQKATAFVSDQVGFPWRHLETPSQPDAAAV
ncbi:hypothetical protein HYPSUDRAFT_199043 [Hypholoma sublateritium FD-334 SS-4]|uniref:Uncharacterized protein n=1 Tax=Hypholoma sublateritium (strain FD-334 SS-4) TaxID=945553 RepID=A0A0D2PCK7_HYPSF|nr:hypothetical protein HYPSUDRAFT_199043 [Hypholoma sublateritium FD-334 SS-4]